MNHQHSYNVSTNSSRATGEVFFYDCVCIKCNSGHSAGFPKDPFVVSIKKNIISPELFFFFITNDHKVKLVNAYGAEKETDQVCPFSDEDIIVKGIIE